MLLFEDGIMYIGLDLCTVIESPSTSMVGVTSWWEFNANVREVYDSMNEQHCWIPAFIDSCRRFGVRKRRRWRL